MDLLKPIAACLLLLPLTYACQKISMPTPIKKSIVNTPTSHSRFQLNGVEIHLEKYGNGMPIIILHGGPGFDHHHLSQLNVLADQYQLIYYDQRGSGDSSGEISPASITMKNFVEDLEALRQTLKFEKVNLLGASFGGLIALYYGIHYPQHLNSLTLIGTVPAALSDFENVGITIDQNTQPEDRVLLGKIAASLPFKNKDPEAIANYFRIFFKAYLQNPELADKIDLTFGKNTLKNMDNINELMYENLGEFDIYTRLSTINCPSLIIHGDKDPFPYQAAQKIHAHIPNSQFTLLEQTGHFLYVEAPERLFTQLRNFYRSL